MGRAFFNRPTRLRLIKRLYILDSYLKNDQGYMGLDHHKFFGSPKNIGIIIEPNA
jgi:hypothetical protein